MRSRMGKSLTSAYCSECRRPGKPGGICTVCGDHWHDRHTIEDCRRILALPQNGREMAD
jgi:hypothetical protein